MYNTQWMSYMKNNFNSLPSPLPHPIHLPFAAVNKIAFLDDKFVSASDDGTLRVWSRRDVEDRIRWYSGAANEEKGVCDVCKGCMMCDMMCDMMCVM